jgi:hypothetical protein
MIAATINYIMSYFSAHTFSTVHMMINDVATTVCSESRDDILKVHWENLKAFSVQLLIFQSLSHLFCDKTKGDIVWWPNLCCSFTEKMMKRIVNKYDTICIE